MRRWFRLSLGLLTLSLLAAAPALAQTAPAPARPAAASGTSGIVWKGWGLQAGASSNPDQFYGGVHFDLGEFARDVRFQPSVDIGVGDHVTLLTALAEVHYIFSKVQVWRPYLGGGAGFTHAGFDDHAKRRGDESDTRLALMGIGGLETRMKSGTKFHVEAKVGLGDNDPDLKLGVGWTWK